MDKRSPSLSALQRFPPELLDAIFRLVYDSSTDIRDESLATDKLLDPKSFPFSLAAVCLTWERVLYARPEYWTRIILTVDSQPTPPSKISAYLTLSRDLPIDIYIIRRPSDQNGDDPHERPRVQAAMELIKPHLHRLNSLCVNIIHRSSLPSLLRDFQGWSPLRRLRLDSIVDDGFATVEVNADENEWHFSAPLLMDLAIDGRNFFDVAHRQMDWLSDLQLKNFALSRYKPPSPREMSWGKLLNTLYRMVGDNMVVIRDIQLDLTIPGLIYPHPLPYFDFLVLQDLDAANTTQIIRNIHQSCPVINITRCSLDSLPNFKSFHTLILDSIDLKSELQVPLKDWGGSTLHVRNSLGFDDRVLDAMSDGGSDDSTFMCARMTRFSVVGCPGVTSGALRKMVNARRGASLRELSWTRLGDTQQMVFNGVRPLLSVGMPDTVLTVEDRGWFQNYFADSVERGSGSTATEAEANGGSEED